MRRYLAVACVVLTGLCQAAFANNGLEGTWKLTKSECSSGAPYILFGGSSNMQGSLDATVDVTENQLRATYSIKMKYGKAYADGIIKQLQDTLALTRQETDSPDKQKSLAELTNSLNVVQQYAAGVNCVIKEISPYTVEGSTLHTKADISRSTTCPGDSGGDDKGFDSTIEIKGNILKLTDNEVESKTDSSCPKGDKTITTFSRVK